MTGAREREAVPGRVVVADERSREVSPREGLTEVIEPGERRRRSEPVERAELDDRVELPHPRRGARPVAHHVADRHEERALGEGQGVVPVAADVDAARSGEVPGRHIQSR